MQTTKLKTVFLCFNSASVLLSCHRHRHLLRIVEVVSGPFEAEVHISGDLLHIALGEEQLLKLLLSYGILCLDLFDIFLDVHNALSLKIQAYVFISVPPLFGPH